MLVGGDFRSCSGKSSTRAPNKTTHIHGRSGHVLLNDQGALLTPAHLDSSSLMHYLMVLSPIARVGHTQHSPLLGHPLLDLVGVLLVFRGSKSNSYLALRRNNTNTR